MWAKNTTHTGSIYHSSKASNLPTKKKMMTLITFMVTTTAGAITAYRGLRKTQMYLILTATRKEDPTREELGSSLSRSLK